MTTNSPTGRHSASAHTSRLRDLARFYSLLDRLERQLHGARPISECSKDIHWPKRGVYFVREPGQTRSGTGNGLRIVRVGTHAIRANLKRDRKLWDRLSNHKGSAGGGGHHRGSVFRRHIGTALIGRDGLDVPSWGTKPAAGGLRIGEQSLERAVTEVIGAMQVLWLDVDDEPGPNSQRAYIERNAIALLSNFRRHPVDPPSDSWLGRFCRQQRVRISGLWNSDHVAQRYEPEFLDTMEGLVTKVSIAT